MNGLKRLWTKITRFAEVLEGIDDPKGDYIISLGNRVDKLERDLGSLEGQLHSRLAALDTAANNSSTTFHAH